MAKAKKAVAALPKGFKSLNDRAPAWAPEVGDSLQGIVTGKKEMDAKATGRQNAKKGEKVRILTVTDTGGVIVNVWESHALKSLMDVAKPGDGVFLRLDSVDKKGKRRFKNFTVGHEAKGK